MFLIVMMQMPKDANNRELYNVIDDPNETKNLVRMGLKISINKTFCFNVKAGSNPEIVLELQKILRGIEPQMASAR